MLLNIPGNVLKHSREFRQTFQGMSSNMGETQRIGGMLYSGECRQIIWGMSSNIPENVIKHSGECCQTFQEMWPIFSVKEDNYWAKTHLELCQTPAMELSCENSQRHWYVNYFRKKAPPQMFDWIPNASLIGRAVSWWLTLDCSKT